MKHNIWYIKRKKIRRVSLILFSWQIYPLFNYTVYIFFSLMKKSSFPLLCKYFLVNISLFLTHTRNPNLFYFFSLYILLFFFSSIQNIQNINHTVFLLFFALFISYKHTQISIYIYIYRQNISPSISPSSCSEVWVIRWFWSPLYIIYPCI